MYAVSRCCVRGSGSEGGREQQVGEGGSGGEGGGREGGGGKGRGGGGGGREQNKSILQSIKVGSDI